MRCVAALQKRPDPEHQLRERKLGKLSVCSNQGLRSVAIYLDSWQTQALLHVPAGRRKRWEMAQARRGQVLHPEGWHALISTFHWYI